MIPMKVRFNNTNAEIILNEFYEISNEHIIFWEFTPTQKYLDVEGEEFKIVLYKVIVQKDNIIDAMEDFIRILTTTQIITTYES